MTKNWVDGPPIETTLHEHLAKSRPFVLSDEFLHPRWPDGLHDPFLFTDMEKAVGIIWQAIDTKQTIGIVGDYDMDGTPAAALLADFIQLAGGTVMTILPSRTEGYGFAKDFVDRFKAKNVKLIITVDCGIRDNVTVQYAKEQGLNVIVTDHHECPNVLPEADVIINPKRPDSTYPFRELCGTGVAFKLAQALQARDNKNRVPENWLVWSLDLVVMATIGDMVPLIDENRVLATYGLKVLQKTKRIGLQHFAAAMGITLSNMGYSDITFKIIPKLNASGRMESMDDVYVLLSSRSAVEVGEAIKRILTRATQSQLLLGEMVNEAKTLIGDNPEDKFLLLARDSWHPGLTGIVAGRLMEEYRRPVGILAGVEEGMYRGSMRSVMGISLPEVLTQSSQYIERFGGHDQAAGLTLSKINFEALRNALQSVETDPTKLSKRQTQGTISCKDVTVESVSMLGTLQPWGIGNEEPLWGMCGVKLTSERWLKDGAHLKAQVVDDHGVVTVLLFGAEKIKPYIGTKLDICGTLSLNEFRGVKEPQFIIRDFFVTDINE